jgi:hypothetical protein
MLLYELTRLIEEGRTAKDGAKEPGFNMRRKPVSSEVEQLLAQLLDGPDAPWTVLPSPQTNIRS